VRAGEVDWGLVLAIGQFAALATVLAALAVVLARLRAAGRIASHAVAVSRRTARAAERRARAAETLLHAARRPWVMAQDLRLLRPDIWIDGRFDAQAELVLRNSGLSPAHNLVVRLEPVTLGRDNAVDVLSRARVALFDARLVSGETAVTRTQATVVVPGQDVGCAARLRSPDVVLRNIATGGLSVVGRLDYDDAEGRSHSARFAFDLANRDGAWRFERRRDAAEAD
jgi:hypothetical protein